LWRDYNGRACVEQRIEELKHDLAADGFCLQPFFATESAVLAVLFTFNLLSLYQRQTTPKAPYRQPGTLRVAVFLCGAVLARMTHTTLGKFYARLRAAGKPAKVALTAVMRKLLLQMNRVLKELATPNQTLQTA
jgi:transposase